MTKTAAELMAEMLHRAWMREVRKTTVDGWEIEFVAGNSAIARNHYRDVLVAGDQSGDIVISWSDVRSRVVVPESVIREMLRLKDGEK